MFYDVVGMSECVSVSVHVCCGVCVSRSGVRMYMCVYMYVCAHIYTCALYGVKACAQTSYMRVSCLWEWSLKQPNQQI